MNIVILSGKMISNIDFRFIYCQKKKNKHTSIAKCIMQLDNGSAIEIYGYDEVADDLYQNQNASIWIEGRIEDKGKIEVNWIVSDKR